MAFSGVKLHDANIEKLLELIERSNSVRQAALALGISPNTVYDMRQRRPEFKRAVEEADARVPAATLVVKPGLTHF